MDNGEIETTGTKIDHVFVPIKSESGAAAAKKMTIFANFLQKALFCSIFTFRENSLEVFLKCIVIAIGYLLQSRRVI
jgi:hypothetical protein